MVTTVLGEISKEQIGVASSHEHIFIDMRRCIDITGNEPLCFYDKIDVTNRAEVFSDPYAILDNALLDGIDDAVREMEYFKNSGGNTVVDCTPDEIGRDPVALKEVSRLSGINIILGCGHYYHKAHYPYVKDATVSQLADEMRKDILVGIGDTDIKAGLIGEIGTSAVMSDDEKKVLKAAGIVSGETGKAVHVHTDLYTENGFEVIDILINEGAKIEKICIDHVDVLLRPDYIRTLLNRGVYVEFDNFGKEFYVSKERKFAYDLERIKLLKTLLDEGYEKQILICNDICLKTMWRRYGGAGYAHILETVKKMAVQNGISEKQYMNKLKKVFADCEIVDFDDVHYEQRIRKSAAEIEILKANWEMVSKMFENVVPKIEVGMTERHIEGMFEAEMMSLGAESYVQAFAPMVATGPVNSHISMCRNTLRKIRESEIIALGAGVCYEGYNGIICSPLVLGKVPQKIKDAVMCAYDALNYASEKMLPGTPCDVVLNAYTDYLTKYGYIDYCPYGSLHSTGMLECEAPVFSVGNKRIIEENMAICIDAYFKGMEWGSFRVEDCYLITDKGAKRMTTYNDKAIPKLFK